MLIRYNPLRAKDTVVEYRRYRSIGITKWTRLMRNIFYGMENGEVEEIWVQSY